MDKCFPIEDIKKKHYELYNESLEDRSVLLTNKEKSNCFSNNVKKLLDDMKTASNKITSTSDYIWINSAIDQWQLAFSSLNILEDIQLEMPSQQLKPYLPSVSLKQLSENDVNQWITNKAYYISKDRKEQLLKKLQDHPELLRAIVWQPYRILEILGSAPEHIESQSDWYYANLHFVSNILDGTINFARQITQKSYWRLEQQWLEDVKQLKSYFIWKNSGESFNAESEVKNYYQACEEIEHKSFNIDVTRDNFKEVEDYLCTSYLDVSQSSNGANIYRLDSIKCKNLIDKKAYYLSEKATKQNSGIDWLCAENYVKTFYENIIPAVLGKNNKNNVLAVRKVLQSNKDSANDLLVNCFEMALVIYFLPYSD